MAALPIPQTLIFSAPHSLVGLSGSSRLYTDHTVEVIAGLVGVYRI